MKRRILLFFSFAAVIAIVGSGTLAYTPHAFKATNVIRTSSFDFKLLDSDGATELTEGKSYDLLPGDTKNDTIIVKNTCENPMYVRVKVESTEDFIDITVNNPSGSEDWSLYDKDGYYYYRTFLNTDNTATFSYTIKADGPGMTSDCLGKDISVKITADAVQANNNGVFFQPIWTVKGWPEEEAGGEL